MTTEERKAELLPARTTTSVERIDWDAAETKKLLINTVAQGATHAEYAMFREHCRATGLNPFKREVWCIITSPDKPQYRKVQIMTGVHGFHAIANSHAEYDGCEHIYGPEIEVELSKSVKGQTHIQTFEWIECRAYRKDRKMPSVWRAFWREYAQDLVTYGGNLSNWAKMPSVMLAKCAESMALRKAFPQELNGLYTEEEMGPEYALNATVEPASARGNTALQERYAAAKAEQEGEALPAPTEPDELNQELEFEQDLDSQEIFVGFEEGCSDV